MYVEKKKNKRQLQAEQTRASIVKAALELFAKKGFQSVTIDDITTAAGVARGSFYTYFKSRSEIIVDQFWEIDDYYKFYAKQLDMYSTAKEKLLAFTWAQMAYVRDTVGIEHLKILYSDQAAEPGSDKMLINPQRFWYTLVTNILKDGQETGEIRNDLPPEKLAMWFNRTMRGLFLDWCVTSGEHFDLVIEAEAFCVQWIFPTLRKRSETGIPEDSKPRA